MISFDNVTIQQNGTTILRNVSFTVESGEKAVIYGKSGSGKSTILLAIVGARIPTGGSIFFDGKPANADNIARVRQSVAFVMQEPELGGESVEESLLLPFSFGTNKKNLPPRNKILGVLEKLHLPAEILFKPASVLSGGEKQRIAIARSLLLEKRVYLLDEVTSALDPDSKKALLDLFANSSFTIISVSHDPQWFSLCTKAIRIQDGTISEISDRPRLETDTL